MKNVIKRNAISITGTSNINTNATKLGDKIIATKTEYGWTLLNCRTGEKYQCPLYLLREHITIIEQIIA